MRSFTTSRGSRNVLAVGVALTAGLTVLGPVASAAEPVKGGGAGDQRASMTAFSLPCGTRMPDQDRRSYGTLFDGSGVNQRSGPSTGCTILGRGYLSHRVDYHCYAYGQAVDGYDTWTYLRNVTTGRYGWVNDSLLDLNSDGITRGSLVLCP